MKKMVLALGSALMLLATTTVQAGETMSFGVQGGGSFFMPTVKESSEKSGKIHTNFEGNLNMFVGGGLFFDYMLMDSLSVGLELGYSRKGFSLDFKDVLEDKGDKKEVVQEADYTDKGVKDKRKGTYIDALDIAIPFNFFPMGEEEGLSLFVGPKFYFALSEKEVENKNADKNKTASNNDKKDKVMNPFNVGATVGAEYEIGGTGFFVGANYEFFFLDTFNSNEAGKKHKAGLVVEADKDKTFYTQGAQVFVGFDFASLLD